MSWLWAGFVAAGAAWQINKMIVKYWGDPGTVWITPPVEEILKTGGAFIFNANLILTHGLFGTIEAVYDLKTSGKRGLSAAIASLLGHFAFGAAANAGLIYYQSVWAALLFGTMGHLSWNILVSLMTIKKKGKYP